MKQIITQYWKDEAAAESIETIILTIVSISIAIAVGWTIYNSVKRSTEKESCDVNASPFCVE